MSSDEDKKGTRRRPRRKGAESSEEEESGDEGPAAPPAAPKVQVDKSAMGKAMGAIDEARRKKLQDALIEGMFVYAEKKYGKKRPISEAKKDAMEDFELYLRSIRAKVKTADDKLNGLLKQKKDIDEKVAAAEKEANDKKKIVTDAETEKENAVKENRDPVLPKDFIIPKKLGAAKAGMAGLVMKASAGAWEDKFAAMRSKKKSDKGPGWAKKKDNTSALLSVGAKKPARGRKAEAEQPNPFGQLKKAGGKKEGE